MAVFEEDTRASVRPLVERLQGGFNLGFQELRSALFLGPQEPGWSFYVDDAPLDTRVVEGRVVWEWRPGFYAGSVTADLVDPSGRVSAQYVLDVSPDPAKLGQSLFNHLLEDIRAFAPSLVFGAEPATSALGAESDFEDENVQCSRLLYHGSLLGASLQSLRDRPHRMLQASRALRSAPNVKSLDLRTIQGMLRNPSALALIGDGNNSAFAVEGDSVLLDVPSAFESFDTAANRCIVAVLRAVARRALRLTDHFRELSEGEQANETRTSLVARWPRRAERIDTIVKGIHRALAAEPLRSVSRAEVTAAGLTAVAAHPLYSRVHRLAWKILRPGLAGDSPDDRSWMSPTWEIFERWCFVQLCTALKATYPDADWRLTGTHTGRFRFLGNAPGKAIALHLQPTFAYSASPPKETGFWSVSGQYVPDLVLVIEDGQGARWAVFDAKYRRKRSSVLDAMRSAHVYHDALRRFESPPMRSLLLLPADLTDAQWLTLKPFHEAHGVGAVVLSRDDRSARDMLADLMGSAN